MGNEGRIKWVKGLAEAVMNESGDTTGFTGTTSDITRRKHTEEELEHFFNLVPDIVCIVTTDGHFRKLNLSWEKTLGHASEEILGKPFLEFVHPDDRVPTKAEIEKLVAGRSDTAFENRCICKDGSYKWLSWVAAPSHGDLLFTAARDITERKENEEQLKKIEWLLSHKDFQRGHEVPSYGDLTELNTERTILDRVGKDMLTHIMNDYIALLGTSVAVYEKNGDYALGIISSGWCRLLDKASRDLCETGDNAEALACGRWICHESCWTKASKISIKTGRPVDCKCSGGIRLYTVPIIAGKEILGAINFGYGTPPRDPEKLQKIADAYGIAVDVLIKEAFAYEMRPQFIIDVARYRLKRSAQLIGEIVSRRKAEDAVQKALDESCRRNREISSLLEGADAVLNNEKFMHSAKKIFDSCKHVIGASAGYVALLSADGKENRVLFLDSGSLPCTIDPLLSMPVRGLSEEAYRQGRTVYENDFRESEWMKFIPEGHVPLDTVLFAPLTIENRVTGIIGLANKAGGFDDNDGRLASAFGELAAISLRNSQSLESLEKSEERFRSVVETATDAIVSADSEGNVVFWNCRAEVMFGYSAEEIAGKPLTSIMPERYRHVHQNGMKKALEMEKTCIGKKARELAGLRKDGSEFPLELSLALWKSKDQIYFTAIIRDITERKVLEKAVLETEERERQLIGSDLHDGLGQLLTGISLKMQYLVSNLQDAHSQEADNAKRIKYLIEKAKEQTRLITRGLMPVDKGREGISTALEALAFRTREIFNIPCVFRNANHVAIHNIGAVPHLYRIAQEAVTNAAKHADPGHIEVCLSKNGDKVTLTVKDDGRGIPMQSVSKGIGMQTMHYRAGLIGASLDIASDANRGTLVTCILSDAEEGVNRVHNT